ncbi:MAG: CDP-alcohol phosphatidyltransferase family protein [Candidatus Acidiferrales bacterium]
MLPKKLSQSRIFTVPNELTFLRLGFLPIFLIALKYGHYGWGLVILILASCTDGLDGLLARKLNQKTPLGAYLDPIADKLLLSSSFVVLALKRKIAWWLTILVLSRDVLLLVGCAAILLAVGYRPFPPSIFGKAATFFEILLVVLVLLLAVTGNESLAMVRMVCGYVVAACVILSGVHYSMVIAQRLHAES